MNIFTRGISIMLIAVLSLVGCGGGGGGAPAAGGGGGTGTFIAGTVTTNQAGATVSYYATIAVKNNTSLGLPITNATVSVNGTNLLLEPIMKVYVGAVSPDAAGKFNLSVAASGVTYTATDAAITSVPVVTTPNPFVASAANTVSWTAPTGAPASMKYAYTLTNTSNAAQAFTQSNLSNSVTIPANTTAAGTTYSVQLLGGWAGVAIANAAAGSSFGASVGVYPTSIVAQTGVVTLPAVPVGVAASAVSVSQINLSWTAVTGATGYNVYRSATAGVTIAAANKITATPVATTTFSNTGLTAATPYFYKVTAVNGAGETVGSAEVTATTQAAAVTPPASGVPAGTLMGGTIQGTPLVLSTTVSTLVGPVTATPTSSPIMGPTGVTTDGINLYVANSGTIYKVVIASGAVTSLASLPGAYGITTDGINLYATYFTFNLTTLTGTGGVSKIAISTGVVSPLAGAAAGYAEGTGSAALFNTPSGITTDGSNLYVADKGNNAIRKVVIATGAVTTLAGAGWQTAGSADGIGSAATFNFPRGVVTDGTNLYVADTYSEKIRKIVISTATVTTLAGSGIQAYTDGTGTAASFNWPTGITTDGTNLYVTSQNAGSHNVRKIVIASGVVTTIAGNAFALPTNGVGTVASFWNPNGITSDGTSLFVADTTNNQIRRIR